MDSLRPDQIEEVLSRALQPLLAEIEALRGEIRTLRSAPRPPRAVRIETAAAMLGCSEKQVFRLLAKRRLARAPKVGRRTMIVLESIEALQTGSRSEGPASRPRATARPVASPAPSQSADELAAAVRKVRV